MRNHILNFGKQLITMKRTKSPQTSSLEKKIKIGQNESSNLELEFINDLREKRQKSAKSITEFNFKKKRVQILSETQEVKESSKCILYWMARDMRVQDNWAFLFAQKLALKNEIPLMVAYCLLPKNLDDTLRHYKFVIKGLQEIEEDCKTLNITFKLLLGPAPLQIPELVKNKEIGAIVCDFSPLRECVKTADEVKKLIPKDIPLIRVDAHNIVPVWITSDKQEYAARTIRGKINSKLDEYLTEFPPLIAHPFISKDTDDPIEWDKAYASLECDMSVDEVEWAKPGYKSACSELQKFCTKRLKNYQTKRNDPTVNALSNLSPWFHFGQIAVQRCILVVKQFKSKYKESVEVFCEEAIVRRELSDNFCFYNENYDNLKGVASWAFKTLDDHRKDKRSYIYSLDELENGKTHDDLWNSAQIQLLKEGKIHGFLRMYWAKKILEWTTSPEEALKFALLLNDKYSLDGHDPNGYVGCMWSIGGIHDQGWGERQVFGKIRYMNYQGCKRKFDVPAFVARYGGKVYSKQKINEFFRKSR